MADKPRAPKLQSWAWWKLIWQVDAALADVCCWRFQAGRRRLCKHMCGIVSYPALWFSLMLTLDTDGLPRKTPATCTGASITNRKNFLAPRRSLGCAKSSQATLQRVCLVAWFFGLCDNSRSGLCQLFMAAAHCAGKCMQQVWFWELASSKLHSSFVLAVIGAEKCVQWTYVVFSSFFRVKPKDIASDKTCKQQTWLLESLLQSEANGKRVWSFLVVLGSLLPRWFFLKGQR